MIKIVLITPILQHYRLTFYEKLSNADVNFDLAVFYGFKDVEDGRPSFRGQTDFDSRPFKEFKFRLLPFDIVYNKGMLSAIKSIDPDVIIVQGIAGDITNRLILRWAKRKGKIIIIWACGWDPGRAHGVLLKLKNYFVFRFFNKADYFLTYSAKASTYVNGFGINESIIETCYNGIETDGLKLNREVTNNMALEIRKKLNLDNYITFIYVGGLIKEKRVDLLIDAFIHLRGKFENIKLIIIGDGPLRVEMEQKLGKANDMNIYYLGRIVRDVDAYFAASDCLVLPGIGGLALNQAMFWGKTCIVSKADGTEDDLVIEGFSGYRFSEDNLDSLTGAMEKRILEDPAKVAVMSENAYHIIENKSNVNNMVNIFSNAIKRLVSLRAMIH